MTSQRISGERAAERKGALVWAGLGFALVLSIAVVAMGVALPAPQGEAASPGAAVDEDTARALLIHRAGEWRHYDDPGRARAAGLEEYRAGERGSFTRPQLVWPTGWAEYRAGERAAERQ